MRLRILFTLTVLFSQAAWADSIRWFQGTLAQAEQAAADKHLPVLALFHEPGCGACDYLLNQLFLDASLIDALNTHSIPVLLNGPDVPDIVEQYQIWGYPSSIVLRPNGEEVDRVIGAPQTADEYRTSLTKILETGKTLSELQAALAQKPHDAELEWEIFQKYATRGDADQALQTKDQLEKDNPSFYAGVRASAVELAAQACAGPRPDDALRLFRELLTIGSEQDQSLAYQWIASIEDRQGKSDEVFATWAEAIAHFPKDTPFYSSYFAYAVRMHSHYPDSEQLASAALAADGPPVMRGYVRYTLAQVYHADHRDKLARQTIDDAIAIDGTQDEYKKFRDSLPAAY